MATIQLKPGREKAILRKHPWIFSGAISNVDGDPQSGETVTIRSANGDALGLAAYSPYSSIRARMWTFDPSEKIDPNYFSVKLRIAFNQRHNLKYINSNNTACRLVFAESDGLPGLIVDKYDECLVVQFLSAGPEYWKEVIVEELKKITSLNNIYERSDMEVRKLEGLPERKGMLSGSIEKEGITIIENGKRFLVDIINGQKTGFYLDQRNNRQSIQKFANGKKVLNCFSYTGAFTVYALDAGAEHVSSIDSSENANLLAKKNITINDLPAEKTDWVTGDVFKELRTLRDKAQKYDMIILDPPKFAPTAAQVRSASRGYKDINLLALKLLNPGGILATFSCSGGIERNLFQKIVADAALDAGVSARILEQLSQGPDHPIALNFPEGAYLKGLICQIN